MPTRATATCPPGTQVIGGGYSTLGAIWEITVWEARRVPTSNTFEAHAIVMTSSPNNSVRAYATCAIVAN